MFRVDFVEYVCVQNRLGSGRIRARSKQPLFAPLDIRGVRAKRYNSIGEESPSVLICVLYLKNR
jgi:hypothetical protein